MPQSAERFRSLSKSKGRTVWFVLLRLSKNFVFRTVSRSKPRFRAKPKKNRALRAHFFFPCINSEIHKVNCRIAAREGGLGHAPGIYEFAKQIRLNACCRTKHKNKILLFRQASHPAFAGWFFVVKCVGGNWRNVTFIFHKKDTSAMQRCLFIHLEMNGFLERIAGFEN